MLNALTGHQFSLSLVECELWEPNVLFLYSKLVTGVETGGGLLHILLIKPLKQNKLKTAFNKKKKFPKKHYFIN